MYTQRIIHFPALGKAAELRAACEARNNSGNAAGAPHSLAGRMFATEPALIASIRHESLAALENYQAKNATDSTFQAQTRAITEHLSRPQEQELFETLVPAQPASPPQFTMRVRYSPAPGKGPELRRLLEERIRTGAPGTLGAGLAIRVAPPDGPEFALTILFANLAGMDEFRAAQAADPTFQPFIAQVAANTVGPVRQELARILQPFPAS